jgi:hypothetical protein
MYATNEDLHGGLVALTLLVGVMLANDPQRDQVLQAYQQSLQLLDQTPEWKSIAKRAKAYGENIVGSLRMQGTRQQSS